MLIVLREYMSKKTFVQTDKKGRTTTWEWEETPELLAALEKLSKSTQVAKDSSSVVK
tara:strand:+ start:263 stop:433 length:171 start_codon:yes stop_codon:yes gene_type:complete